MSEEYSVGYEAGYQDGWNAAVEQPVRTKDLTDDEIEKIVQSIEHIIPEHMTVREWKRSFARAVIAAYKEKNK